MMGTAQVDLQTLALRFGQGTSVANEITVRRVKPLLARVPRHLLYPPIFPRSRSREIDLARYQFAFGFPAPQSHCKATCLPN